VKFLENIVHKMEPKFAKGGKLEKWHPMFESFTTLAFTPANVTQKGAHIRDGVDLKRTDRKSTRLNSSHQPQSRIT